jgi:hypothetical protein
MDGDKCLCEMCTGKLQVFSDMGLVYQRSGDGVFVTEGPPSSAILGAGAIASVAPLYVNESFPGQAQLNDDGSLRIFE